MSARSTKLWAGRFAGAPSRIAEEFTHSLGFDQRLYSYDIRGSRAHCRMLGAKGILSKADATKIERGLKRVEAELDRGDFEFSPSDEDIHSAVERRLTELIGPTAGRLHTGRSRNDQVLVDVRMYLRDEVDAVREGIEEVRLALARLARENLDVVMPGYTHLQRAQPVLLGHHLLAYYDMLGRDADRLAECRKRVNVLPLGSGALAGVPYPLDRKMVARELDFEKISTNSIDAVSDRDFVTEFLADGAILFAHLSRLASDLTMWATEEFGFVQFPDEFSTGSSIMPQKKNPDVAEIIRGKSGRMFGHLQALLVIMKGLPLSYNSDLQEDKEALFDACDTANGTLRVLAAMLPGLRFNAARMREASCGFLLATEIADYLVEKGTPFREAHGVVGAIVRWCIQQGREMDGLEIDEFRQFSDRIGPDLARRLTPEAATSSRRLPGGTAKSNVARRLRQIGV